MKNVIPIPVDTPEYSVLSQWMIAPGAFLLLGMGSVPREGTFTISTQANWRGIYRSFHWNNKNPFFVIALRLNAANDLAGHQIQLNNCLKITLKSSSTTPQIFAQDLAKNAGENAANITRFLFDTFQPIALERYPSASTMIRSFLNSCAIMDGCIEMIASVPNSCVLLQGWGAPVAPSLHVVLAGASTPYYAAHTSQFERKDIKAPATGIMVAIPAAETALASLDHVFLIGENSIHSREIVNRRILSPEDSIGHIRHMMPTLQSTQEMRNILQEALRPKFEGKDTLSNNPKPVRAAIDFSAYNADGLYLAGWIFDPAQHIKEIQVRGPSGFSTRIDQIKIRVLREDVSTAFASTPWPKPTHAQHGFAVHVRGLKNPSGIHLKFIFEDGDCAFMPLNPADAANLSITQHLLSSVDLYKPSGTTIIERHLAPFIAGVRAGKSNTTSPLLGETKRPTAIVIPLPHPQYPRAFLSQFLFDPLDNTEQIVFACGPNWSEGMIEKLIGLAQFYQISPTIICMDTTPNGIFALQEASMLTKAETFLLGSTGLTGEKIKWRQTLRDIQNKEKAVIACPTILYEDWSIRFAGSMTLEFLKRPPYIDRSSTYAGMPSALMEQSKPQKTHIGSLACCSIHRQALLAIKNGLHMHTTEGGWETAFFLQLNEAKQHCIWVPNVRVYAPEDPPLPNTSERVGQLVDGWILRERWRKKEKQ